MYLEFYGLKEKPFSQTPDPRFLYWNDAYRETLASLSYGIRERKGFIAMLGEAGTGKTTLLRKLLDDLGDDIVSVFLFNPNATFEEILEYTLSELGIPSPSGRKLAMLQRLNEFLLAAYAEGRNTILLIDEAQDLDSNVMESLRLLSNLETANDKILQIVLSGQPELADKLAEPGLRQLKQRIAVRCRIEPLQFEELSSFIEARLEVAGGTPSLFEADALPVIWEFTNGIPRLINTVCDNALLLGYALGKRTIDYQIASEVTADLRKIDADQWGPASGVTAAGESTALSDHSPPPQPATPVMPPPSPEPFPSPTPDSKRMDRNPSQPPYTPSDPASPDDGSRDFDSFPGQRPRSLFGPVAIALGALAIGLWLGDARTSTQPASETPSEPTPAGIAKTEDLAAAPGEDREVRSADSLSRNTTSTGSQNGSDQASLPAAGSRETNEPLPVREQSVAARTRVTAPSLEIDSATNPAPAPAKLVAERQARENAPDLPTVRTVPDPEAGDGQDGDKAPGLVAESPRSGSNRERLVPVAPEIAAGSTDRARTTLLEKDREAAALPENAAGAPGEAPPADPDTERQLSAEPSSVGRSRGSSEEPLSVKASKSGDSRASEPIGTRDTAQAPAAGEEAPDSAPALTEEARALLAAFERSQAGSQEGIQYADERTTDGDEVAIEPGDTLDEIANRRYGSRNLTTLDMLRVINPEVRDVDLIIAGDRIILPEPGPRARIVPDGDGYAVLALTTETLSRALSLQSSLEERFERPVTLERIATRDGQSVFRVSLRGFSSNDEAGQVADGLGPIDEDPRP